MIIGNSCMGATWPCKASLHYQPALNGPFSIFSIISIAYLQGIGIAICTFGFIHPTSQEGRGDVMKMVLKQIGKSGKRRSVARLAAAGALLICALGVYLSLSSTECFAGPTFYTTSDPTGHWYVSWNTTYSDSNQSFLTGAGDFQQAVLAGWRSDGFITNFSNGYSNGINNNIGNYTFFVFRQTFDLTGYDPATAVISFQWCADDSGEGYADRGTWKPKFRLNGGDWNSWPGPGTETYGYSVNLSTLSSGFLSGSNYIDFYVEGNGRTDGFGLRNVSFTADPSGPSGVPEPATMLLLGLGLAGLAGARRFRK
jgi:hypothetical protein